MRLAPLTGIFGTNSSGKTSILQLLLVLKQTVEASDPNTVLQFGGERAYVELGTFEDIVYGRKSTGSISIALKWKHGYFSTLIRGNQSSLVCQEFNYRFRRPEDSMYLGMKAADDQNHVYILEGRMPKLNSEQSSGKVEDIFVSGVPAPLKFYSFPQEARRLYAMSSDDNGKSFSTMYMRMSELTRSLEGLFSQIYYLGPLRADPRRSYTWSGERPKDVGRKGELTVAALLTSNPNRNGEKSAAEMVAHWLKEMGLIHSFEVFKYGRDYEVRIKKTVNAPEVLITDVGFGVSQIVPVLTLLYYVPKGSIVILEQPEIHLHPKAQAELADVLIAAIKERNLQIILESHSEHLLRRLQRRIAEEEFKAEDAALYFCTADDKGTSHLEELKLNEYGYITNWPHDFFGDEMEDLAAQGKAMVKRRQRQKAAV